MTATTDTEARGRLDAIEKERTALRKELSERRVAEQRFGEEVETASERAGELADRIEAAQRKAYGLAAQIQPLVEQIEALARTRHEGASELFLVTYRLAKLRRAFEPGSMTEASVLRSFACSEHGRTWAEKYTPADHRKAKHPDAGGATLGQSWAGRLGTRLGRAMKEVDRSIRPTARPHDVF